MIVLTKLWVDVQQGEDESVVSLVLLLPQESYEADNIVEQKGSQHRCGHLGVTGTTEFLVIFLIGTVASWMIPTPPKIILITRIPFTEPSLTIAT